MTSTAIKDNSPEILTPADLARVYKTTKPTVLSWYHKQWIPAVVSIGRVIRFDRDQVAQALAARANNPHKG